MEYNVGLSKIDSGLKFSTTTFHRNDGLHLLFVAIVVWPFIFYFKDFILKILF